MEFICTFGITWSKIKVRITFITTNKRKSRQDMFNVATLPLETSLNPLSKLPDDSLAETKVQPQPLFMVDDGLFQFPQSCWHASVHSPSDTPINKITKSVFKLIILSPMFCWIYRLKFLAVWAVAPSCMSHSLLKGRLVNTKLCKHGDVTFWSHHLSFSLKFCILLHVGTFCWIYTYFQ